MELARIVRATIIASLSRAICNWTKPAGGSVSRLASISAMMRRMRRTLRRRCAAQGDATSRFGRGRRDGRLAAERFFGGLGHRSVTGSKESMMDDSTNCYFQKEKCRSIEKRHMRSGSAHAGRGKRRRTSLSSQLTAAVE